MARKRIPEKFQHWIDARKRHHLSHSQVQMARELGMNPKRLGKIDNDDQEPWKLPLPRFIEALYEKRFGKTRPEVVLSMGTAPVWRHRKRLPAARRRCAGARRARDAISPGTQVRRGTMIAVQASPRIPDSEALAIGEPLHGPFEDGED